MDTLQTERAKRTYTSPTLEEVGPVARLTMGNGGSSMDGNMTFTQRGIGNDGGGPH